MNWRDVGLICCSPSGWRIVLLLTIWGFMASYNSLMQVPAHPYDELAARYHLIFEDWGKSIVRQAAVLEPLLLQGSADKLPIRVLDCACGIGTQSLGLAMRGFEVEGCDISSGAIQRARNEAADRGLKIPFSVASLLHLDGIAPNSFDAAICIDNSLPHLESNEELLQAARQIFGKLKIGGAFIGSVRDYDALVVERPTAQGPCFYSDDGRSRIVFQVWDWLDERRYRFHLYITRNVESGWDTFHFTTTYRAVLRTELQKVLQKAGFAEVRWLLPSQSGFYQPMFVAIRNC